MQRFKEHGFVVNAIHEFEEHSKALDEVLKRLAELQKRNNALLKSTSAMKSLHEFTSESVRRTMNVKRPEGLPSLLCSMNLL